MESPSPELHVEALQELVELVPNHVELDHDLVEHVQDLEGVHLVVEEQQAVQLEEDPHKVSTKNFTRA